MNVSEHRRLHAPWSLVFTALLLAACDPSALSTKTSATNPQVQKIEHFDGVDHLGEPFSLTKARSNGPVVVIFYRGHW